jgi:hypothetical protein
MQNVCWGDRNFDKYIWVMWNEICKMRQILVDFIQQSICLIWLDMMMHLLVPTYAYTQVYYDNINSCNKNGRRREEKRSP